MFQTSQLYRIGDDAGQHVCRVKKYIDDMKIDDQSEKIRIFIGSLEQDAQFEIFSMPDYGTFKNQFDGIIEKFMNLYKTKESKASPIMDLLQFNQGNLTLREFITKLRVELYKARPALESTEREKTLIFAFLYGISNKISDFGGCIPMGKKRSKN